MTTTNTTPTESTLLTRSTVTEALANAWASVFGTPPTGAAGTQPFYGSWFSEAFNAAILARCLPDERITQDHLVNVYGELQAIADGIKHMLTTADTFLSDEWVPIDIEGTLAMAELELLGAGGDPVFMLGEGAEVVDDGI